MAARARGTHTQAICQENIYIIFCDESVRVCNVGLHLRSTEHTNKTNIYSYFVRSTRRPLAETVGSFLWVSCWLLRRLFLTPIVHAMRSDGVVHIS